VNWVELVSQKDICSKLTVDAGVLFVYQSESVITKSKWSFDNLGDEGMPESFLCQQLGYYINNPQKKLTVSLKIQGTGFRRSVWAEICKIPVGQVISYGKLAEKIGSGARAVANACRDNPFPGIIPCHRVVSANGLGGFMGEATGKPLELKKKLLSLEADIIK
jgi:methylated-DNA-[protein]-cysteine S-methyltransferase